MIMTQEHMNQVYKDSLLAYQTLGRLEGLMLADKKSDLDVFEWRNYVHEIKELLRTGLKENKI